MTPQPPCLPRRGFLTMAASLMAVPLWPGAAHASDAAPTAVSLAQPATPPRSALELAMKDADGATVSLAAFAGQIVVLNLWAPWCLPCRREMPSLSRLSKRLEGQAVAVLPLCFDWRGAIGARRFFTETEIENLPVLIGDGENLASTLGLERLPTTAILDRSGQHVLTVAGEAQWDDDATYDWLTSLA